MANVAPAGGSAAIWWVEAVAYPAAPSTSVPVYVQGASDPNAIAGPFTSKAEAEAWVKSNPSLFGPGVTNIAPPVDTPVTSGTPGPAKNPLTGLAAIGDFFSRLGQASTWVRVGEVILGLVLVAVGVARITHAVPIATQVAKTAGAVALA